MMDLLLWQLVDSGFPSGAFAHSGGLEATMHLGEVADSRQVRAFVSQVIAQAARGAVPLVVAAHHQPGKVAELDALCDAFLSNPVANRASRAQGRAFLMTCSRAFARQPLQALHDAVCCQSIHGHYAPIFGAVLQGLGVDRASTKRLFLFSTARGVIAAAVRLGLLGMYEAQTLQADIGSEIVSALARCAELGPFDIAQTAPLVDLFQSTHDRLYSRLFQS